MHKMLIIIIIFVGCLLLLIGLVLGLKFLKPSNFNLICGVIIIGATLLSLFGKYLQDISSSKKTDKIAETGEYTKDKVDSINQKNIELINLTSVLNGKLELQSSLIDKLRSENTDLYIKLSSANSSIYEKITGGDSYCFIEVFFTGGVYPTFNLAHSGKTQLRDIQITFDDLERRTFLLNSKRSEGLSNEFINNVVNMTRQTKEFAVINPNTIITNLDIPIEKGQKDIRLAITFYLNNATYNQSLDILNFANPEKRSVKNILKMGDKIIFSEEF